MQLPIYLSKRSSLNWHPLEGHRNCFFSLSKFLIINWLFPCRILCFSVCGGITSSAHKPSSPLQGMMPAGRGRAFIINCAALRGVSQLHWEYLSSTDRLQRVGRKWEQSSQADTGKGKVSPQHTCRANWWSLTRRSKHQAGWTLFPNWPFGYGSLVSDPTRCMNKASRSSRLKSFSESGWNV